MTNPINKLAGKKIIVVGGTSGIGFGAASIFLASGAHVTVISSSESRVNDAVARLKASQEESSGASVTGATADVRDERAFVDVLLKLAPVDHIVFSGVDKIIRGKLEDLEIEDAKWLFGVKFWGAVIVGKAVLKHDIILPGGSLTLTSGMAAIRPGIGASVGGALNGGILSLTKGLAAELAAKKIRVNTVIPGLVQTELWDKQGRTKENQKEFFKTAAGKLAVGFVANSDDIAEAYLYLVRANYATGSLVEIDGGSTL